MVPYFRRFGKEKFHLLPEPGQTCRIWPMERVKHKSIFWLCPLRHLLGLLGAVLIVLHRLLRGNTALMRSLSARFVRPTLERLGESSAKLPFSMAELLIAALVLGLLAYLFHSLKRILRFRRPLRQLYRLVMTPLCLALAIYGGFCLLWGTYYYGDDFVTRSGLETGAVSTEELRTVTAWFADLANTYSSAVPRDENGVCATDRKAVLERSPRLYQGLEEEFPCLKGPALRVKSIGCSRLMSYLDFTGFFSPFTAEANVNMDFPPSLFAATVAHELAHQRGVAKEQEANFVAVLACLHNGNPDDVYSAALLAYSHLSSALYTADRFAWQEIYERLDEAVLRDFAANRSYWQRFETPVQSVSNTVYEGFLQSYDQELGLRSYGACVDLLVKYYGAALATPQEGTE